MKKKFKKCAMLNVKYVKQDIIDDIEGREVDIDIDADPMRLYDIKVLTTRGKDINETTRGRMDELRKELKLQGFKYFLLTFK
jgi:hypothetical protein